jgi:thioesterase domain-containing protein
MSRWRDPVAQLSPEQRTWLAGRLAQREGREGVLTAVVVPEGGAVDETALRQRLRERLPEAAVPTRWIPVDEFPRLPNGKTDRGALARMIPRAAAPEPVAAPRRDRDPVLQGVLTQWRELLGHPGLEPRDNVFELGAHSLLVIQCAEALSAACGIRLPVTVVFQHPAPYDLANWIRLHQTVDDPPAYDHIFPVHIEGDGAPLFAIQPDFFSGILTEALRGRRPVYGLRGVGLRPEGNAGRWPDLAALADDMIEEIRAIQPEGPYWLSGYSFGAVIAFEVARRMEARGLDVERLVLFDPTAWNIARLGPLRLQLRQCRQPVTELSSARAAWLWLVDNRPWAAHFWRRWGRIFGATPYRRVMRVLAKGRASLPPRMMQADSDYERFRLYFDYQPTPISTPTLFFTARGPDYDAAQLWRPLFTGPFDLCTIDTVHQDLGATPETQAQVLAELRQALKRGRLEVPAR